MAAMGELPSNAKARSALASWSFDLIDLRTLQLVELVLSMGCIWIRMYIASIYIYINMNKYINK